MIKKSIRGVPIDSFQLDLQDEICILERNIDWKTLNNKSELFKEGYVPLQPVRRLVGLFILEKILNISGAELLKQWLQIPYYQYFTGETLFHWDLPISVEELEVCKSQLSEQAMDIINIICRGVEI